MREGPLAELFRATEAAQKKEGDEKGDETARLQLHGRAPLPLRTT